MAALFFQKELVTTVETEQGVVLITQYEDDECTEQTGQVCLSKRQFEEMFNRSKTLFEQD